MINFNDLQKDIRDLIVALTGQNVIWQDENGNTPSGDCIFLKINNLKKPNLQDFSGNYNITFGKAKTQGDREFILNIQCISKNSMQILTELVSDLELNENQELLGKLVYIDADGDVTDITTKIDARFEHRSTVDLNFRISKNYSVDNGDNVSYIETIEVTSKTGNFEEDYNIS